MNKTMNKKGCVETPNSRIDDIGFDVLHGLLKLHQRLPHAVVSELVGLVVTQPVMHVRVSRGGMVKGAVQTWWYSN